MKKILFNMIIFIFIFNVAPQISIAEVVKDTTVSVTASPVGKNEVGKVVTFTGSGSGESSNYEYEFWLKGPGTNNIWRVQQNYSTSNTWAWVPGNADIGANYILVYVRNIGSTAEWESISFLNYKISFNSDNVTIFDFGTKTSPINEGAFLVTEEMIYSPQKGFGWVGPTISIHGYDDMILDLVNTDYLQGSGGESFQVDLPNGAYEVALVVGTQLRDVPLFKFDINNGGESETYTFSHNFESITYVSSLKGRYTLHIYNTEVKNGMLQIVLREPWLVNAIIVRPIKPLKQVLVSTTNQLPVNSTDFYYPLDRDSGQKWSRKFGYDYQKNWDYIVKRRDEILLKNGADNADIITKLSSLANYINRKTASSSKPLPSIDELNSPVDILDPDGSEKGSCFGLARTIALFANTYGYPSRLIQIYTTPEGSIYDSIKYPYISCEGDMNLGAFHVETEVFYNGKWHLYTNGPYAPLQDFDVIEIITDPSLAASFPDKYLVYSHTERLTYINLYRANFYREEDLSNPSNSYIHYDAETARRIYPEKDIFPLKVRDSDFDNNILRIGEYWQTSGTIILGKDGVARIKRIIYVPSVDGTNNINISIPICSFSGKIAKSFEVYFNGYLLDTANNVKEINDLLNRNNGYIFYKVKIPFNLVRFDENNEIILKSINADSNVSLLVSFLNKTFAYQGYSEDNKNLNTEESLYCDDNIMLTKNSFYSFDFYGNSFIRMVYDPIILIDMSIND